MKRTLLAGAGLVLWGNSFNLLHGRLRGRRQAFFAWGAPLSLLAACLGWHCVVRRAPLRDLGLTRAGAARGALLGATAGSALAAPALIWFRLPGRAGRVEVAEAQVTLRALLLRLLVVTPLLVALVEEVAFRGFLQGRLQRALPERPWLAVLSSNAAFALWHVTVNVQTLRRTNVVSARLASLPLALAGGLAAVFFGGLVFGALYARTRSLAAPLAAPLAAHWTVDALMLLALWRRTNVA